MDLRLSREVERVILLQHDDQGRRVATTVYRKNNKRKKGTGPLEPLGKVVRKIVAGQQDVARVYLARHDESNREKADGWVRDLPYNVYRTGRLGFRKIRRATGLPSITGED
jgi:hypothetical protein